ncbi:Uma2 family endonuclease [Yinghuangia aomiensis]
MAYETPIQQETLEFFHALETPMGFRAELIDGEVVVSPPPAAVHEHVVALISKQMGKFPAVEMLAAANAGLVLPGEAGAAPSHVIPDLTIVPEALNLLLDEGTWTPPDGVEMVVEVTSSRPERDRTIKRLTYARAGIPLYLLVDRDDRRVTLFSKPRDGDYEGLSVPFGEAIPLPAPFGFDLDTKRFA